MTKLWLVLFIGMAPLLSSCGHITIHDHVLVADKGDLGGFLIHTQTSTTKHLDKAVWDDMRVGMLCLSPKDFGEDKGNLEKLCSFDNGACTVDQTEQAEVFFGRLNRLLKVANAARAEYEKKKGH